MFAFQRERIRKWESKKNVGVFFQSLKNHCDKRTNGWVQLEPIAKVHFLVEFIAVIFFLPKKAMGKVSHFRFHFFLSLAVGNIIPISTNIFPLLAAPPASRAQGMKRRIQISISKKISSPISAHSSDSAKRIIFNAEKHFFPSPVSSLSHSRPSIGQSSLVSRLLQEAWH